MPRPFHRLTVDEFAELLASFPFERRITAVHMHHTWRPAHAHDRGESTIEGMWRFHTEERGWSDIAQHVTIASDGAIWTGRSWNAPPASAAGHNGNRTAGPFMFEIIGDFDAGRDRLEGAQRNSVIEVIARVQHAHALPVESLAFHNALTTVKTCPGTSVSYDEILDEVRAARARLDAERETRSAPRGWAGADTTASRMRAARIVQQWNETATRAHEPPDAELDESDARDAGARLIVASRAARPAPGLASRGVRGAELAPEILTELRPHVVNLTQGRFSTTGQYRTSRADVDAIFGEHLPRALAAAKEQGRKLPILVWAHGGLISESAGLTIAHLQVAWWIRNGVYPLHFVWETGFCDALKQILAGVRGRAAARDVFDYTTDLAIEGAVGVLGGDKIWSAMKRSAELAVGAGGGAAYVATKLAEFGGAHRDEVTLHAVGHSAGSIFHAHFLPFAFRANVPQFATLQLLAPAVRVDEFKERLLSRVGGDIASLTMFTMTRDWEEDDHVATIYRKSLLYLIHYGLEPRRTTPILGLEESVRDDGDLAAFFGLGGATGKAEVVWSVTHAESGRAASTSRTHGGFDNDRPTMNSVARRILDRDDIVDFPEEAVGRGLDVWALPPDLPPALAPFVVAPGGAWLGWTPPAKPGAAPPGVASPVWTAPPATVAGPPFTIPAASAAGAATASGRRRALCVGIDRYLTSPLAGCVADANAWAATLRSLGFDASLLLDGGATRNAILAALDQLVTTSAPGDVVVFQFAGHGTELTDVDADETGGTNGPKDEALCPFDMADGAFVIDDDIGDVFRRIPDGVALTCFIDCCHSGTITRVMMGGAPPDGAGDRRARYVPATPDMEAAHRRFRERLGRRARVAPRDPAAMREVLFSACLDREVAYESAGHGDFTVHATGLITGGVGGLTNEEFQRRVEAAFGARARQHPDLDCAPDARSRAFLQPLAGRVASAPLRAAGTDAMSRAGIAQVLRTVADVIERP